MRDRLIDVLSNIDYIFADGKRSTLDTMEFVADYLLENGVIVPPCKVGDKFYKIEKWCTEGGFWDKPRYAYSSTCEDCYEECDGKIEIIEYTFHSTQQILSLERTFGQYVFLTREEAEQVLRKEDEGK